MLVHLQYAKLTFYLVSSVLILIHMLLHSLLINYEYRLNEPMDAKNT
jgi:hypothetical protein